MAVQNVDELVLPGMGVAQRRASARRQPSQVYPEIRQSEQVSERVLHPALHARSIGFGIDGWLGARRSLLCHDGYGRVLLIAPIAA